MDYVYEYHRLKSQLAILRDVTEDYPRQTIGNIMQQMESRIKCLEGLINEK